MEEHLPAGDAKGVEATAKLAPKAALGLPAPWPERCHCSRNPKWGPSDFGCTKLGDGHGLRRPAFVLRPFRRALRAAPGLLQWLDAVSHGPAFRLRRRSRAALRRNARPYGYVGVVALRSSLTLPRFSVFLRGRKEATATLPDLVAQKRQRHQVHKDGTQVLIAVPKLCLKCR